MMLNPTIKIGLSIISTIIIYYFTNMASPSKTNINDGQHLAISNIFHLILNHNPGHVCTLGKFLGKIAIIACLFQIYYIYNNKYDEIKNINLLILIISFLLSFLNSCLQNNIMIAFVFQLAIIFL